MAVHGFGVDAARAADAAQVGEQPLPARADGVGVVVGFFQSQTFKGEAVLRVACCVLRDKRFVGEENDFDARGQQGRDDVALQEVDDCHAVVGGDEDAFGHDLNSDLFSLLAQGWLILFR